MTSSMSQQIINCWTTSLKGGGIVANCMLYILVMLTRTFLCTIVNKFITFSCWSIALGFCHYCMLMSALFLVVTWELSSPWLYAEFTHFLKVTGIKHIHSAPYHPSSNALAKRFEQTLKCSPKANEGDSKSLQHCLVEFLFNYCSTTHAITNVFPSELFWNDNFILSLTFWSHTPGDLWSPNR